MNPSKTENKTEKTNPSKTENKTESKTEKKVKNKKAPETSPETSPETAPETSPEPIKIPKQSEEAPANDNAKKASVSIIGNAEPVPVIVEHRSDTVIVEHRSDTESKPEHRTTPILGLHPAHSEVQIESRYLGYVQGVRKEADERALVAHKEAAEPVGVAAKAKEDQIKAAKQLRERTEQAIEQKHLRATRMLKSLRQSRLTKAENAFVEVRDASNHAFYDVAKSTTEKLKVKLMHIANDLSNKIIAAGKEYTPAKSRATAIRQKAEAEEVARKEREEAELAALKELQEESTKNEDGDEKVLTKPST